MRNEEQVKRSHGFTADEPTSNTHENLVVQPNINNFASERILRETVIKEAIERPFTTEPHRYVKRGNKTIRDTSIGFIDWLSKTLYQRIPQAQAERLFQMWRGSPADRTTLKAYFGTRPGTSKRRIRRTARYCRTETTSVKIIDLEQDVNAKEGYFEFLKLVHFEKCGRTWFMILENPVLVPTLLKGNGKVSIDNFSLSPILVGIGNESDLKDIVVTEDTTHTLIGGERKQSSESEAYSSIPDMHEALSADDILNAKPQPEPDRSKVKYPEMKPIIPGFEPGADSTQGKPKRRVSE